jgi:hypothetical protein
VHEEFLPTNGATTVTLGQPPNWILMLSRAGVVQSSVDGNYSLSGSVITFTDALNGSERIIVDYAATGYTPVPPISGAGIADGTVTSAKIADGTIATADLADRSVTNIKLGTDTARLNLLTNGGFEIWQRGSGPFTGNSTFSADRWLISLNGADTLSVSRTTNPIDAGSIAAASCAYTFSAGKSVLMQQLKPTDAWQLLGRTITLSVRLNSTAVSMAAVRIDCNGTGGGTVVSSPHNGNGQWQTLSVTATVPLDSTIVSLMVQFDVRSGTAYLDNATLVVGSVPADYAPLHPADDLARCLRYYERVYDQATGNNDNGVIGQAFSGNQGSFPIWYSPKPVTPTITSSAASTMVLLTATYGTALAGTAFSAATVGTRGARGSLTVSPGNLVAGNATTLQMSAGGFIAIEANP